MSRFLSAPFILGAILSAGCSNGQDPLNAAIQRQAAEDMDSIEQQVAQDAEKQYGIVARNGTAIDRCAQAAMVAAAYLQATDEPNYQRWKQQESADCAAAGIPGM